MRRIIFLSAIAIVSLFSFLGCDDENKILNEENGKPAATDSIPTADSIKISITLNCDSLSLYVDELDTLIATVRNGDKIVDYQVSWSIDNASIAVVDSNGVVTALSVGTAVITVKYEEEFYTCKVVVTERPIIFEYVDLGLSVCWATFNVGATKPEEFGDYYAWGETETKSSYDWSTYKWCNGSLSTFTKYCNISNFGNEGFTDTLKVLTPEDDVAYVKWGGSWRMPTKAEQDELRNNCTWIWTTLNGVNGILATSNKTGYTDRSIFLPAAGHRYDTKLSSVGDGGSYWSSSLRTDYPDRACNLNFIPIYESWGTYDTDRSSGYSVRPVCPSNEWLSSVSISFVEDNKTLLVGGNAILSVIVKNNNEVYDYNPDEWNSDNPSVAIVDQNGAVTALSEGIAHITVSIQSLSAQCTVFVVKESDIQHDYVDLGLSVKWATCNVGAMMPQDYGAYYAWGETETKSSYIWKNYKFRTSGDSYNNVKFNKYNTSSNYGTVDNKNTLDIEDDVAHVKWGGSWRMPTKAEQDELRNNCTWALTTLNGINGYLITSNKTGYTDCSIFLPAAGYRDVTRLRYVGSFGYYWSSSLDSPIGAYGLQSRSSVSSGYCDRYYGLSVRPVCPSEEWLSSFSISFVEDNRTMCVGGSAMLDCDIKHNGEVYNNAPVPVTWSSDNPSVVIVDQNGAVTALSEGIAHITAAIRTLSAQCTVTVVKESDIQHDYVDLGLSVKWATFNVGATKPEEFGDYYAWGETETKSNYAWSTYKWCNGSDETMTKYCNNSDYGNDGFTDILTVLTSEDDVAHVKWGGSWRMPTLAEQDELLNNCTWALTTLNGVNGYLVTSNKTGYTDCSIFLPAAGYRDDTYLIRVGFFGYYWSSSLLTDYPGGAYGLQSRSGGVYSDGWYLNGGNNRNCGLSVRPVCP